MWRVYKSETAIIGVAIAQFNFSISDKINFAFLEAMPFCRMWNDAEIVRFSILLMYSIQSINVLEFIIGEDAYAKRIFLCDINVHLLSFKHRWMIALISWYL